MCPRSKLGSSARHRPFTVFATQPGGDLSINAEDYDRGTHPWILSVRATDIRAAYALVNRQQVSIRNGDGIIAISRHDDGARSDDWGWNADVQALIPNWMRQTSGARRTSRRLLGSKRP
jgi:hypothetical protein